MKCDLHVHSTFSDGENTPEEMVLSAISLGLDTIGFSDHSYMERNIGYCMTDEDGYKAEISRLKEKYRAKINILCGIEQDYFAARPAEGYDYIIGSVHNIFVGDESFEVDSSAETTLGACAKYFGGDIYALAEEYYRLVADVKRKTGADIIGHFDLLTKFNEKTPLFDESNPRYTAAWKSAADSLLKYGVPFEINYGAITRGYRTTPYPSPKIREYIISRGGRLIQSSDSHRADTIGYGFI